MASLATDTKSNKAAMTMSWSKVAAGTAEDKGKAASKAEDKFQFHIGVRAKVTTSLGESFTARIYTHDEATGLLVFGTSFGWIT